MARIRSIKPEFPQSESMGRVSRDARLLFILLWPICDDHGRTRAASRLLANTLFPYDDDARDRIDGWLDELEAQGCIRRYEVGGSTYLEVCKWLIHQKIDKPSKPQFPEFAEGSATTRESSRGFVVGREGKGEEGRGEKKDAPNGGDSPNGSPPADPLWGTGLAFLVRKGLEEQTARRLLGKLRKEVGDIRAGGILAQAEVEDVADPVPWIMAAAQRGLAAKEPQPKVRQLL